MRSIALALIVASLPLPLLARDCSASSSDVLSVSGWQASSEKQEYIGDVYAISLTLENKTDAGIRMIEGTIYFDDVLGRSIVNLPVDEDVKISAKGTFEQSGTYSHFGGGLERLPNISPSDVTVTVCVKALVTNEGKVERFDGK